MSIVVDFPECWVYIGVDTDDRRFGDVSVDRQEGPDWVSTHSIEKVRITLAGGAVALMLKDGTAIERPGGGKDKRP